MKEHIDVITELAKQLYEYTKGLDTMSLEQCDAIELMLNNILCNLEDVRCQYYEFQSLEHDAELIDFAPEDLPF